MKKFWPLRKFNVRDQGRSWGNPLLHVPRVAAQRGARFNSLDRRRWLAIESAEEPGNGGPARGRHLRGDSAVSLAAAAPPPGAGLNGTPRFRAGVERSAQALLIGGCSWPLLETLFVL